VTKLNSLPLLLFTAQLKRFYWAKCSMQVETHKSGTRPDQTGLKKGFYTTEHSRQLLDTQWNNKHHRHEAQPTDIGSLWLWFQLLRITEIPSLVGSDRRHTAAWLWTGTLNRVCVRLCVCLCVSVCVRLLHGVVRRHWFSRERDGQAECRKDTGRRVYCNVISMLGSHKALLIYIFIYSFIHKTVKKTSIKTKSIRACS